MEQIKTEDYCIWHDPERATIFFQGSLRLRGVEHYQLVEQLLNDIADREPPILTLNLQELEFLNSSGINVLSRFVLKVRQKGNVQMLITGSKDISWQERTLKNLQRLMVNLQLEFI